MKVKGKDRQYMVKSSGINEFLIGENNKLKY
jgi:hypothetical protein